MTNKSSKPSTEIDLKIGAAHSRGNLTMVTRRTRSVGVAPVSTVVSESLEDSAVQQISAKSDIAPKRTRSQKPSDHPTVMYPANGAGLICFYFLHQNKIFS